MLRGRRFWAFLLLAAGTATAVAGTWRNYTSMKDVKGIARDGHTYWAATSGGLFRWDEGTTRYQSLTNAEGLRSIDLTAIDIDHNGTVWTGASTGVLHAYSPSEGILRSILDIANFQGKTDKNINAIAAIGDTLVVSTDFGLSMYNLARGEFGDTFTRFGTLATNVNVICRSATISTGRIWVAISDGASISRIASASLASQNLLAPDAWTLDAVGGTTTVPLALASFSGRVYAGTTAGLFSFDGATWQPLPALAGKSIIALKAGSSTLVLCTSAREVWTVDQANNAQQQGTALPFAPTSIATDNSGNGVVGVLAGGIVTLEGQTWTSHFPNGPNSYQFVNVTVAPDGTVWGASGKDAGKGMYRFNGKDWKSFTTQNSPLPNDQVYRVSVGCSGSIWGSTYGGGFVEILPGTDTIDASHVYGTNVGMVGVSNNISYIAASSVACDAAGNVVMTCISPADRRTLTIRESNGTWRRMPVMTSFGGTPVTSLADGPVDRCFAVDASDNLWAVIRDPAYKGVVSLRKGANGEFDSVATSFVTSANGLPSNNINTIVVDKENDIWVGTDLGIAIISDPDNPTQSGGIAAYTPLDGLVINSIAVDALNQKWVGTSEGVILLSPDGVQELASYTVESTDGKLMDNNVLSVAVDGRTGNVYFGTASGLASLTTSAVEPKEAFGKLTSYPSPYRVPNTIPLTIDGLVANSNIKILTSSGSLVREVKSPGGRVGYWDGRDARGGVVASGIYIVVGFTDDGSQTGTGKIAVIRTQ